MTWSRIVYWASFRGTLKCDERDHHEVLMSPPPQTRAQWRTPSSPLVSVTLCSEYLLLVNTGHVIIHHGIKLDEMLVHVPQNFRQRYFFVCLVVLWVT